MPGQSYLVVDSALSDSVLELATVIDHYNPGTDYVEKVNSFVIESEAQEEDEEEEVQFKEDLYSEIATTTQQYLLAIPDRELEPVANLVIHIFSFVPESFESLTKQFLNKLIDALELSNLNKKKYIKSMAILSILSNVFNFMESESYDFKNHIFELITRIVEFVQNGELLQSLNLEELLIPQGDDNSKVDLKLVKSNFIKYSELISQIDESKSLQALELIINKVDSSDNELISKYLTSTLNSKTQIDLSSVLSNSKLQSSSDLIALIKKYQTLSTEEFISSLSLSSIPDLNKDLITQKNRYLNLSKLTLSSTDSALSYKELSAKLSFSSIPELERFLILAIQNKVFQGKLSQSEQIIKVYKTLLVSDELTKSDWTEIKRNLNEWQSKLKDIKSLIDSSKKKLSVKA